jgi:hypothetical protein
VKFLPFSALDISASRLSMANLENPQIIHKEILRTSTSKGKPDVETPNLSFLFLIFSSSTV